MILSYAAKYVGKQCENMWVNICSIKPYGVTWGDYGQSMCRLSLWSAETPSSACCSKHFRGTRLSKVCKITASASELFRESTHHKQAGILTRKSASNKPTLKSRAAFISHLYPERTSLSLFFSYLAVTLVAIFCISHFIPDKLKVLSL